MSSEQRSLKFIVVLSSNRQGRMSDRMLRFVTKYLTALGHTYQVMDPKELKFPMLEMPLHWYPDKSQAPSWLVEAESTLLSGDAYLFVTGEYNRCVPPALANIIDHFGPNVFSAKMSAIVSYSLGAGGANVSLALTGMIQELGGMVCPAQCVVQTVSKKLTESGDFVEPDSPAALTLESKIKKVIKQTAWYACAFQNHKNSFGDLPS